VSEYEDDHRVAIARELTYAAGFPLRDRYGFAASRESVLAVIDAVFREPDDLKAGDAIGVQQGDELEIAENGLPASIKYEQGIIAALRPMVEQRRDAAVRRLG
jgi:hypothetical protein